MFYLVTKFKGNISENKTLEIKKMLKGNTFTVYTVLFRKLSATRSP